jgi:hypothetical protein
MGDAVANLRSFQMKLQAVPHHHRGHPEIGEVIEDAHSWIEAMAKEEGFEGHVGAPLIRPKGIRGRILHKVAVRATVRFGLRIRPSTVDKCWKTYKRRFLSRET